MASPINFEVSSDETFPAVDVNGELYPGVTNNFPVDPVSSEIHTSKKLKEQAEAEEKKSREMKKKKWEHGGDVDGHKKLKSTVLISGVVVAVIGAIFALTKKMREKPGNSN
ncbi:hypothetical protein FRX31_009352 [Thalictrum thalictroides]|uniref:Transmembrane protein n=1 Tax=Thalictrum thalictroides TaxID=46969 RepID=A0A7J6WUI9_THATH|nr:hypothetical protein FRX31_009352 [Thalictrum thalictroides]